MHSWKVNVKEIQNAGYLHSIKMFFVNLVKNTTYLHNCIHFPLHIQIVKRKLERLGIYIRKKRQNQIG